MKRYALCFIFALLMHKAMLAQAPNPTTFIWNGNADDGVGLYSVDGVPTFSSGGWGGSIYVVNGYDLRTLNLPQPGVCSTNGLFDPNCTGIVMPFLPNQSSVGCDAIFTWGTKQWGTRADGTTMDGTQSGDFYDLMSGPINCALWNGSATINLDEHHQFEFRRVCILHSNRACLKYGYVLQDINVGGNGTAVGTCTLDCPPSTPAAAPSEPIASLYRCGSNRRACLK